MITITQYVPSGQNASEISADVEAALRDGRLAPGAALPPVRSLAAALGLSPATVSAAYRDLHAKGIARGQRRAGTRITAAPPVAPSAPRPPLTVPEGVRDLLTGSPDPALLPDLPLVRRPRVRRPPRLYGEPAVSPRLARLATDQLRADGIDPEHLAVVGGALDGVERVLAAWLRPGGWRGTGPGGGTGLVGVEDPGYPPLLDLLIATGQTPVPMAMDSTGVRPEELARALARGCEAVVFTPRAQAPTGAAWDAPRAAQLAEVLARHPDAGVIEDDHAGQAAGAAAHTVTSRRRRWAVVRSVSKTLGPDLRLAVLAGDAVTVSRVEGRQALGTGWVSHLLQETVAELWQDPATGRLLARAAAGYARNRRALIGALAGHGIAAAGRSGLAVWVPVADEPSVTTGLLDRGWAVAPGERFRLAAPPGVRIGVATLTAQEAARLAADLAACLHRRPRRAD